MDGLSVEQAKALKADMIAKRDRLFAEYNKCIGAITILDLADGTIKIVEEDGDKEPDGSTP